MGRRDVGVGEKKERELALEPDAVAYFPRHLEDPEAFAVLHSMKNSHSPSAEMTVATKLTWWMYVGERRQQWK